MDPHIDPIDPLDQLAELADRALITGVARSLVPSEQLLYLTSELRRLRLVGASADLSPVDAEAALWACRYARTLLAGARYLGALDAAIFKLQMIARPDSEGPP